MGCGISSTRRVYPIQRHSGGDHDESPPPRPVTTVSKATQTPPLSPENDERISDDGSHELDKVILAQSVEQESAATGREDRGEQGTEEQEPDDGKAKKDGEVKVEPIMQQTEEDDIETIRTDQGEAKPAQDLEPEIDSKKTIEKTKSGGDQEMKSEEAEGKEEDKDKPTLIVVEKAAVQDPSPIPSLDSKIEKETAVATKPEAVESTDGQGNDDDKPSPQISKPDKLLPTKSSSKKKDTEDPSNQELNKLKSSQHHPDPVSSPSHPLKPLPNIDDGIRETKSEPRLPLLPPIGSKKITALQTSGGVLKSNSATGIAANIAATKEQPKGPSTEKRKDGRQSAPSSDQASSTKRKKKSTDSLRSTSGSSISKSKKSSSSISTVSLGQKSKSRESLRSGPQNRLTTTVSKSSDNLANGAAKKLSISKESLKAASQVYSSVPAPKSGGELSVRKSDSGKSQSSKSKEAAVKAEKERESSDQKPPDKKEMIEGADSKVKEDTPRSGTSQKKEEGDGFNPQDDTATKGIDLSTKETELPPTSVEKQTAVISDDPPVKMEKTNEITVTVSEPEEKVNTDDQASAGASPKEEADKNTTVTDKEGCDDDGGEKSDAKEVKDEVSATAEPTSTSASVSSAEKEQVKSQDQIEDTPPPKPTEEKTKMEAEESSEAPAPSTPAKVNEVPTTSSVPPTSIEVKIEDTKIEAKDDASETATFQEQAKEAVSKSPPPSDVKETPAAGTAASETTSQTASSEFACKLEIDKKTGQSEQSIVEAVEKSTEPVMKTRDVSTPA